MSNKCIESYSPELNKRHSELVAKGMSDRQAAIQLANEEYSNFLKEYNNLSLEKQQITQKPAPTKPQELVGDGETINTLKIGESGEVHFKFKIGGKLEIVADEALNNVAKNIQEKNPNANIEAIKGVIFGKVNNAIAEFIQRTKIEENIPEIDSELLDAADNIDYDEDSDYRKQLINESTKFEEEDWPTVEKWLHDNFPHLPIYRVKNMIDATNGKKAWGMLHKGALYLYQHAEAGTAYHEVFEAVWKMLTPIEEQSKVINEFKNRKGSYTDRFTGEQIEYSKATPAQIKEELAEEFRDYILFNKSPLREKGKSFISKLFYDLVKIIKEFFTGEKAISNTEELFKKINTGYYKTSSPTTNQLRYATNGFIDIDDAVADSTSDLRLNISAQYLNDVVQHMTYSTLTKLIETDEGLFNASNLLKEGKKEFLDYLYNSVLGKFAQQVKVYQTALKNNEITQSNANKELAKLNTTWVNVKNNWNDVLRAYNDKLYTLGIQFDENDELALTEDKGKDDPYGDARKIDSYRKANSAIKLLLATLPVMENGKPKRSSIGGVVVMPSDKVFFTLKTKLFDSVSIDDMLQRLSDLAKSDENYVKLYRRLTKTEPGESVNYNNLNREGLHLVAAFWKSMKAQQPDVLGVFILPSGEVVIGDSSLAGAAKQSKKVMLASIVNSAKKGNKYIKYKEATKTYSYTGTEIKLDSGNLNTYISFLNELGIEINANDFNKVDKSKRNSLERKFKKSVEGIKKSIQSIKDVKTLSTRTLGDLDGRLLKLGEVTSVMYNPDFESTYFNMNGDIVQSFLGVNIMSNFFDVFSKVENLFNDLPKSTHSYLLTDVFSKGSVILKRVFNPVTGERLDGTEDIMKPVIIDGMDNDTKNKTKDSTSLSPKERLITELNLNNEGIYLTLVPGDASIDSGVRMHGKENPFVKEGEDYQEIFKDYFISEVALSKDGRIVAKNRNAGDLRFFKDILGESLHKTITSNKKADGAILYNKYEKEIKQAVDNFINQRTENVFSLLEKYNMIKEEEVEGLSFIENTATKAIKDKLKQLTTNYIIANIEFHKLIYSDPYQYSDELKRIKNFTSPKQAVVHSSPKFTQAIINKYNEGYERGDIGSIDNIREYFRTVTMEDIFSRDDIYNEESPYEETDGGGYITLKAKRTLMIRAGEWSEDNERQYRYDVAYEKVAKNIKLSPEEQTLYDKGNPGIKDTYTTLKPIAAGTKANSREYNDIDLDKFALVVLSYRILHQINPESNALKLYNKWQKEDIDYGVYSTGRKGGAEVISPLYNSDGSFNEEVYPTPAAINSPQAIINIPFHSLFIQSEVPSKDTPKTTEGSQITKLATMDFLDLGVPVDFMEDKQFSERYDEWNKLSEDDKLNASPLYKEIRHNEALLVARIEQGYEGLLKELGIEETEQGFELKDRQKLIDTLSSEIMRQDINSNIKKAFEAFKEEEVVLESTPAYTQIRNILYSIADHNVVRKKISGGMKVQIPSSLLESNRIVKETIKDKKGSEKTIFSSDILSFYKDEDGKRVCEIMVGRWFDSNLSDKELIEYLNNSEEGKKILGGIGFRIPTQKQNSIDVFKIKQFLPKDFGDQVVVPSALVKKVGSDFDIDKLSVYLKNVFKDLSGRLVSVPYYGIGEQAKNKFKEIYTSKIQEEIGDVEDKILHQTELSQIFSDIALGLSSNKTANKWIPIFKEWFADKLVDGKLPVRTVEQFFINKLEKLNKKLDKLSLKDLSDAMVDEEVDQLYKQSLENEYIESLERLISHPKNFKNLVKPNSADLLKDLTKKINSKLGRQEVDYSSVGNMLNRAFMQNLRYNFLSGKKIIGIAAVGQTNNAQNQRTHLTVDINRLDLISKDDSEWIGDGRIKFSPKVVNTINGQPTLSISTDKNGRYISDILSQVIDGSVDVSKHPWLMELGVSQSTAGTWLFLVKLGIPVEDVAYFMNQPIILEYINSIQNAGYSWMFIDDFVDKVKDIYNSNITTTPNEIPSRDDLYSMLGKSPKDLSEKEKNVQQFMLDEFLKYAKIAGHLFTVVQATNLDTANLNDPFLIMCKEEQYKNAQKTIISSVEKLMNSSFVGKLKNTLDNIRNAYSTILLSDRDNKEAGTYSIRDIMTAVLKPYTNTSERDFVTISRKAVADLFDWAIQTKSGLNKQIAKILIGNETEASVAEQIIEFKNKVLADKSHPLYDNIVLNSIVLQSGNNKSKVNNLSIVGRDNKAFDQDLIISSFNELKEYLGTEKGGLYGKLIRLAILQSGLTNSPIAFTQLLPYEDFKYFYNEALLTLEANPELISFYNTHVFERNNWFNSDIVDVKIDKAKKNAAGNWYFPAQNYIDLPLKRLKSATSNNTIPKTVAISSKSQEGKSDFITYQYEDYISKEERERRRRTGDTSHVHKMLMQKVYTTNAQGERVPLVHTSSFKSKETGETVILNKYIYKAINAWGDSFKAKEFYTSPQQSVLDNGYEKIVNEVDDSLIVKIYNGEEISQEKPVSLLTPEQIGLNTSVKQDDFKC